jgi:Fe-S-cluster containining protein
MSERWYQDGLRFRCTRCGHCCTGEAGFVWVNDAELGDIAAFLAEPVDEVRHLFARPTPRGWTLREKTGGECVFFDRERGCTIYPVRPRQCRSWPFWESNVETVEAWEKTCEACPGAGRGELISAAEITRNLQLIKL